MVKIFSFSKIQYKQLLPEVVYSIQCTKRAVFKELNINIEFGLCTSKQNSLDMNIISFTTTFKQFQSPSRPCRKKTKKTLKKCFKSDIPSKIKNKTKKPKTKCTLTTENIEVGF